MPKRPPKPALETRTTFWSSSFEVTAKLVCAEHQICTAIQVVLQLVLGWYKCLSFSSVPGSEFTCIFYYFWQLINYWDDCTRAAPAVAEDFATTPHEAATLLVAGDLPHATTSPGGTTECTKTSKKFNNRKSVFSIQSEGKTVNFRHNGTHA